MMERNNGDKCLYCPRRFTDERRYAKHMKSHRRNVKMGVERR